MNEVMYLQHYMRHLAGAINQGKEGIDYHAKLQGLHALLMHNRYRVTVAVQDKIWPCSRCGNACDFEQSFELYCGHLICSVDCLQTLIEDCTASDLEAYECVLCPQCGESVGKDYIMFAYGGEEGFRAKLREASKKREPQVTCLVCYSTFPISDLITLDCDHRYCVDCIREYLAFNISEGKVAEDILVCPQDNKPIDVAIIRANLTDEEFARFERFRLNQWTIDDIDLLQYHCRGVDCEYIALVPKDQESITCPVCNKTACPKCHLEPHPKKSCELMLRIAQAKEDDGELGDFMKQSNVCRCPYCRAVIEKKGGCKYMTCISPQCQGKKHFCVDCMMKLEEDHGIHECVTPDLLRRRLCSIF